MAAITSLGVGSGLDLSGLLNQLDSAERLKLQPLTQQKAANQSKISAYGRLQGGLSSLQAAVGRLNDPKTFEGMSSTLSGSGLAVATTSSAAPGTYQVKVDKLAQAQSLATGGVDDRAAPLGTGTLAITAGDSSLSITLDESNNSLEGIRNAINAEKAGVTASIVNTGTDTGSRLVLTSDQTGTASTLDVTFTEASSGSGGQLNSLFLDLEQTVEAQDAELTVNGITLTSQSNTFEDSLEGITLTASAVGEQQTLTISRDTSTMKGAVNNFIEAYNTLVGTMSSLTSYNAETRVAGELLGDAALRGVQSQLRSALAGLSEEGAYKGLSDLGISLQLDGKLKLEKPERLDAALSGNITDLSTFFAGTSSVSSTDGFAGKLGSTLTSLLDSNSALNRSVEGLKTRNKGLDERYARMESGIEQVVERYRSQFAQLDSLIANMNATSTYVSQQFDALNAQLGRE
ncbi:flagellar filament capping protein FliD [Pseudomonas sp. NW5]|uniref:flagellar filament capping protein FliD n=1 Tax=Pseudomonas sp. NW5 TaxID=2934934 RepID=UPI00202183E1|nr:flagellar filament capping protein FliD [Pseudomonas sp. NW5]MCL7461878.1 flagellar filament capping protein FliD [Pseudomonas sp. NW5]